MRTVVRFRSPRGEYALPVEDVTEIRSAADLTPLPVPQDGIAGLVPRPDGALTVVSSLGEPGEQIVVIDDGSVTFGLLVEEVIGVQRIEDRDIGPPPQGQDTGTVAGVIVDGDALVLLLHVAPLRARLVL